MFKTLPKDPLIFLQWNWAQLKPFANELESRHLSNSTLPEWMMDWSDLSRVLSECYARLWVATTQHTDDPEIQTELITSWMTFIHHGWQLTRF